MSVKIHWLTIGPSGSVPASKIREWIDHSYELVVTSPVIARYDQDFVSLYKDLFMNREVFIEGIVIKIRQLPDTGIKEINDFAEFLLSKIDDQIIREGIPRITAESKSFDFLNEEEDLYSVNDLKERYQ